MDEPNIGKIYKERFEGFSEVPDPQTWDAIKRSLPKKRINSLKYGLFTVGIGLVTGIGFYILQDTSNQNTINIPSEAIIYTAPITESESYSPLSFFIEKEVSEFSLIPSKKVTSESIPILEESEKVEIASIAAPNTVDPIEQHPEKPAPTNSSTSTVETQIPATPRQAEPTSTPITIMETLKQTQPTVASKSTTSAPKESTPLMNEPTSPTLKNNSSEYPVKSFQVWVPKAFTPDREPNNIFSAKAENIASFEMVIYNKVGQTVFKSKDINNGWDGRLKNGASAPQDAYIYIIKCTNTEGIISEKKGTVTLIR